MFLQTLLNYLPYAFVSAFTPGPNNLLSMHTSGQGDRRAAAWLILGMGAGFLIVTLCCALLCYRLEKWLPAVTGVMKYVGAAYILYLALSILLSKPKESAYQAPSFWKGFTLQFVNPKLYLYALTIYTGYALPAGHGAMGLAAHAALITLIGLAGICTWAVAGNLLKAMFTKYARICNAVPAAVLIWCAVEMVF